MAEDWQNSDETMLVEPRSGGRAAVFIDDGDPLSNVDASVMLTLEDLRALSQWATSLIFEIELRKVADPNFERTPMTDPEADPSPDTWQPVEYPTPQEYERLIVDNVGNVGAVAKVQRQGERVVVLPNHEALELWDWWAQVDPIPDPDDTVFKAMGAAYGLEEAQRRADAALDMLLDMARSDTATRRKAAGEILSLEEDQDKSEKP